MKRGETVHGELCPGCGRPSYPVDEWEWGAPGIVMSHDDELGRCRLTPPGAEPDDDITWCRGESGIVWRLSADIKWQASGVVQLKHEVKPCSYSPTPRPSDPYPDGPKDDALHHRLPGGMRQ